MGIERLREKKNSIATGERQRTRAPIDIDAERQGFAGKMRMVVLGATVRFLQKLSNVRCRAGADPAEQRKEILDRLDTILSYFPRRLRDLLTGNKDAAALFALLEGKGADDAQGIGDAVETIQRREQVKAAQEKVGRNAPCPCGAQRPDGTPVKYKHCCGQKK